MSEETEDIDPEAAAEAMNTGQTAKETAESVEVMPGYNDEQEDSGGILSRFMNTEPDVELSDVDNPWNPDEGGLSRVYRGMMKFGDIEGLPAALDMGIGIIEAVVKRSGDNTDPETDQETEDTQEETTDSGEGMSQADIVGEEAMEA